MLEIGQLYEYKKSRYSLPKLVIIISGCYTDPTYGRISNFWTFKYITREGFISEKGGSDYNNQYWKFKSVDGYRIETRIIKEL